MGFEHRGAVRARKMNCQNRHAALLFLSHCLGNPEARSGEERDCAQEARGLMGLGGEGLHTAWTQSTPCIPHTAPFSHVWPFSSLAFLQTTYTVEYYLPIKE